MFKVTGTNHVPLGKRRREGSSPEPEPERKTEGAVVKNGPKKRKGGRWGAHATSSGLPKSIPWSKKDEVIWHFLYKNVEYTLRLLENNECVPPEELTTPEPIYDTNSRQINTREARYKTELEARRYEIVEKIRENEPGFEHNLKYEEKVYIPKDEYPEVNLMGQILGPRGTTLKKIEEDCHDPKNPNDKPKISIRGRGSEKEGKHSGRHNPASEQEKMHAIVTGKSMWSVKAAIRRIEEIIKVAIDTDDECNPLKQAQLRELAAFNGTLRNDEGQECLNCGELGHRRFACPEPPKSYGKPCFKCQQPGHIARDCPNSNPQSGGYQARTDDYDTVLRELEGPSQKPQSETAAPWQQPQQQSNSAAPWNQPWGGDANYYSQADPNAGYYNQGYAGQQPDYAAYGGYYGGYDYSQQYGQQNYGGEPWNQAGANGAAPPPPPPGEALPPPPPGDAVPPPPPPPAN